MCYFILLIESLISRISIWFFLRISISSLKFFLHVFFENFFQVTDHFTHCGNFMNWFPYFVRLLIWILYMVIDLFLKVGLWNLFLAFQPSHYLWFGALRKGACGGVTVGCCLVSLCFSGCVLNIWWEDCVIWLLCFLLSYYLLCWFYFTWVLLVSFPYVELCSLLLFRGAADCSNIQKDLTVSSTGVGLQWEACVHFSMSPVKFRARELGCWLGKL